MCEEESKSDSFIVKNSLWISWTIGALTGALIVLTILIISKGIGG